MVGVSICLGGGESGDFFLIGVRGSRVDVG